MSSKKKFFFILSPGLDKNYFCLVRRAAQATNYQFIISNKNYYLLPVASSKLLDFIFKIQIMNIFYNKYHFFILGRFIRDRWISFYC